MPGIFQFQFVYKPRSGSFTYSSWLNLMQQSNTIMSQEVIFTGHSGRKYTYQLFPRKTTFTKPLPGLYIHVKETPSGWRPVRIGETCDLNQRLSNHENQAAVDQAGATHICVRVNFDGEPARLEEEKDLILHYKPELNVQHNREVAPPPTKPRVHPSPSSIPGLWPLK